LGENGESTAVSQLGTFVWSIADQLRGVYKPHQYGDVVLPMTILRRLDCVLQDSKADLLLRAATVADPDQLDFTVRKEFGLPFYNTSVFDMRKLLDDPDNLAANLIDYISHFSANVADIFERFKFENEIAAMAEKDRLYIVVSRFAEVDLHPAHLDNAAMGDLFEELIRKFADAANETAGEHFTPRDAIRLMVDLLFAADDAALAEPGTVRTVYDPTAGTGGMLSVADEHLRKLNPDARLVLFGQEINDQSYAICKSDMIGKGQDSTNIRLGDTLMKDLFADRTFDYCLSNPPYGVDWKAAEKVVRQEAAQKGISGRFGNGLPGAGDGQMLFLCHLASKMRPPKDGGGRAGIVMNGSPLFTGAAGSGESEIRRWLFEADLVDAIIALPTNMFYNTGIATYVWVLDNDKPKERSGKVQLIDGTGFWAKMQKNLGNKAREVTEADRDRIVQLYSDYADGEHCRILDTAAFGYRTITVERPLRLTFAVTPERIAKVLASKPIRILGDRDRTVLAEALGTLDLTGKNREQVIKDLRLIAGKAGLKLAAPALKALCQGLSERDPTAVPCLDPKGNPEADSSLRDTENVPLGEDVHDYFQREIAPYAPDAWIDETKTRIGYEVPFTRIFYRYTPPRPLQVIDAELDKVVAEILVLLQEVEQ
jgi:type I restriction enzyme M protein